MQDYDVALKLLLQGSAKVTLLELVGDTIARWFGVELPTVRNPRVDLLGETASGALVHLELQSTNDANMSVRMAEYFLSVYRAYGRFPKQVLVYVGASPLRMASELLAPDFVFRYRVIDMSELDGAPLLESAKAAFRGGKQPRNARSASSADGAVLRVFLEAIRWAIM